jgi:hypothetical protein
LKEQRLLFQGYVYFYICFSIGLDSAFFGSSFLVYDLSARGQTLAPFPLTPARERTRRKLGSEEV